jgi:Ca-activated chloride channel homolog
MTLQWPFMLPLLILVPILLAAYIWMQRRRRRFALRYSSLSLLKEAVGTGPGIRRHIPPAFFLVSLAVMLFALTRPVAEVQVPSFDGTVVLSIDVSGSMAATDLEPDRLEAAKAAARDFVNQQPGDVRVGVVAFSGFAALVQAPTTDRAQVLSAIDMLQPQRSTAIGEGLVAAMKAIDPALNIDVPSPRFGRSSGFSQSQAPAAAPTTAPATPAPGTAPTNSGIIVLLSDGQNTSGVDPLTVAPQAKALGIRVYTVGIGTTNGTVLRLGGRGMRVRLDESTLRQIADITGGQYFNAQNEKDLRSIYHDLVRQFGMRTERTELTAFVTGAAALLALVGGILSLLWFSRLP